jgi:hypothetical protein
MIHNPTIGGGTDYPALLSLLREGRDAAFEGHAQTLMHGFAAAIRSSALAGSFGNRTMRFTLARPELAFRGFGGEHVHALVLASSDADWTKADSPFWRKVESTTEMPFILACGPEEFQYAQRRTAEQYVLVFGPQDLIDYFQSARPLDFLKQLIRSRFRPGILHPFDHQHPIYDATFRGRHSNLQVLRDNPNTNFALVGPSKMGKTSMVKRHLLDEKARGKSPRQFYIDLLDRPVDDLSLARAIRMAVDPSLPSYYNPPDSLADFLGKFNSRQGGIPQFALDECDRHLELPTMRILLQQSVKGNCRLILVGRWKLMKYAVHTVDDNFNRLEPIVLPPLSIDEAVEIVEKPLGDMDFELSGIRHDLRHAVNRLGRVPGLVQELGAMLVQEVEKAPLSDALRRALARVITVSRLIGLLNDLSSPESRAAALLLALHGEKHSIVEPLWIREQLKARGTFIKTAKCMEICDELVIHHLLISEGDIYRMARWDIIAEGQQQRPRFTAMFEEALAESTPEKMPL